MQYGISILLSGISLGGQYALIAIGYTMVYGILRLINFAHGDVFMAAGLIMVYLSASLPIGVALPLMILLTVLLGFVWLPLASLLGWISWALVRYILWIANGMMSWRYHAVYFTNPYLIYWLLFLYAAFIGCAATPDGKRKYLLASALSVLTLTAAIWVNRQDYQYGVLTALTLDVGQGESVILTSGGETALVDCGSSNSYKDPGGLAADTLHSMGVRELSAVVVTHYHADHTNGLYEVLRRIPVQTVYLPDIEDEYGVRERLVSLAEEKGAQVTYVTKETADTLGDTVLTIYPPVQSGGDLNELGLTALASAGDFDLLRARFAGLFQPVVEHRAADHHRGELFFVHVAGVLHADEPSLAHHAHAVADCHDLVELVRDDDDRHAQLAHHAADDGEQLVRLLRGEDGGRLVEDQNLVVAVEHLEDLGALLHTDGDVLDERVGVNVQAVLLAQGEDLFAGLGLLQKAVLRGLHAHDDVVEHGEAFHQLEVLVDHADPQCVCIVRVLDLHHLAVFFDDALLRLVQAEQHAHQRTFAGAIFAQQSVYLAFAQLQGDIIVCLDPREFLGDVEHLDHKILCQSAHSPFVP